MRSDFDHDRLEAMSKPTHRVNPGRGFVVVLDFVAASHARAVAFLLICCALFFLPGFFTIPVLDREEAVTAQISKQMVENDNYIDLRFQNADRDPEPLGIFWLQAASVKLIAATGLPRAQVRIFPYRIPSLIGALGAVMACYWAALAFVGRRGATLASLTLCSCFLLGIEARLARPDTMLLFAVTAAMGAMARAYLSWQRGEAYLQPNWLHVAVFWGALTLGLFIDGSMMLLYLGLTLATLAVLDRSLAWLMRLHPLFGLTAVAIAIAAWALALLAQGGSPFLMLGELAGDLWGGLLSLEMFRRGPPGTQFVMYWVLFWPGAALTALVAPAVYAARREPGAQFLLAWVIPSWIAVELLLPKLSYLILPLFPAMAIIIVGAVERRALAEGTWFSRAAAWWFVVPAVVAVAAIVASIAVTSKPAFAVWPFAAGSMIFGLFAWWLYDVNRGERSLLNAIGASLLAGLMVFGLLTPALTPLFPSVELSRIVRNQPCERPVAAAAGYQEPSLVFMAGTSTLLTDASGAADFLQQGTCRVALVESRQERAFATRAEAIGLLYAVISRVEGYDYSIGRRVTVTVFRAEGVE